MKCKQAKRLILDLLYDEISPESASELQEHIASCEDCLKYKTELQQTLQYMDQMEDLQEPADLIKAVHDAIDRERVSRQHRAINSPKSPFRKGGFLRPFRWPVWAAVVGLCGILFSVFTLFASEIQYEDGALTIRFKEKKADLIPDNTDQMLAAYRAEQLRAQKQLSDDLRAFVADELRASESVILKAVYEYEAQQDEQVAAALQHYQIQQERRLMAIQKDLDTLTSLTENEFVNTYTAMAELASY